MKVKIVRIPAIAPKYERLSRGLNSSLLPPLALPSITGFLRKQGIYMDQDDLNIKLHHDNAFATDASKKVNVDIFLDQDRITDYLNAAEDKEVLSEVHKIIQKTDFSEANVVLFSIPDNKNSSHILIALCIAKYLKETSNPVIIVGIVIAMIAVYLLAD